MRQAWSLLVLAGLSWSVGLLCGCQPPRAREGGFDSPDPASKLYAICRAGRQHDRAAIGHLIEQLESDDPAVRLYAIAALYRITGQRLGYKPYDPPYQRRQAVERWKQAWQGNRLATAQDLHPSERPDGPHQSPPP